MNSHHMDMWVPFSSNKDAIDQPRFFLLSGFMMYHLNCRMCWIVVAIPNLKACKFQLFMPVVLLGI